MSKLLFLLAFYFIFPIIFSRQSSHFTKNTSFLSFELIRSTNSSTSTSLQNIENIEYLATVAFGSQAQSFSLLIDTGSADIYIPSASNEFCLELNQELSEFSVSTYPLYDCGSSETCVETNQTIVLSYDDGVVVTRVVWDEVAIGSDLKVNNQSFLLAESMEGNFDCAGIWGLGYPNLAQNRNPGIIANLLEAGEIEHYMFGLFLTSNESDGSRLIIGGVDDSLIKDPDDIGYFPFIEDISYSISINSFFLDGTFELDMGSVTTALPDSGNSEITFPSQVIDQIKDYLNNQKNMSCSFIVEEGAEDYAMLVCEVSLYSGKFPNISIGFNGTVIELEPEDYIEDCLMFDNLTCLCETNLESSLIDSEILLGDAFLQSFYSIFDLENNRLGLTRNTINNTIKIIPISSLDISFPNILETSTSNIVIAREFDWKAVATVSGLLGLLPIVAFTSYFMRRNKRINEGQSQMILGVAFIAIIIAVNLVVTLI